MKLRFTMCQDSPNSGKTHQTRPPPEPILVPVPGTVTADFAAAPTVSRSLRDWQWVSRSLRPCNSLYPLRIRQLFMLFSATMHHRNLKTGFHDLLCGISGIWKPHTFQIYISFFAEKNQTQSRPGLWGVYTMVQKIRTIHLKFLHQTASVPHASSLLIQPSLLLDVIWIWCCFQPLCKDVWHVLSNPRSVFLHLWTPNICTKNIP